MDKMYREEVYISLDSERTYQDKETLNKNRPDMIEDFNMGAAMQAMNVLLRKAGDIWYTESHENDYQGTMDILRKIGGVCVQMGEKYGMPKRKYVVQAKPIEIQKLLLVENRFDDLLEGKLCTIRNGHRNIVLGDLLIESTEEKREKIVDVIMVYHCDLRSVIIDDVNNDGFKHHIDMLEQMEEYYPDITLDSIVTVIKFQIKN